MGGRGHNHLEEGDLVLSAVVGSFPKLVFDFVFDEVFGIIYWVYIH
jgi:hypothetical protein